MKKSKLIIPFISLSAITTVATPLLTLTGCQVSSNIGNIMKEYTPTLDKLATDQIGTWTLPNAAITKFIDEIKSNPQYFVQDMLYTMSRGLKRYNALLISKGVQIKSNDFDVRISNVSATWESKIKVTFDLTIKMNYDYSGTPKEIMQSLDLNYYTWSSKPSFHMSFDFDTDKFTGETGQIPNGKRRQITFIDGIAHIGISECESTIQVYEDKGTATNLNGDTITINVDRAKEERGFINPSYEYWSLKGDLEKYDARLNDIKQLKQDGYYVVIDILDQYLGNDPYIAPNTPNSIDFGSYHMGNGSLAGTFEYNNDDTVCYGFNYCNGPDISHTRLLNESCYDVENQKFTLPIYKNPDPITPTGDVNQLDAHAFDALQSNTYNIGLPIEVKELVIPAEYVDIGIKAITSNASFGESQLSKITFKRSESLLPCELGASAFYNLPSVKTIDLSAMNTDDYQRLDTRWKNAFEDIHIDSELEIDGQIILPYGCDIANWKNAINNNLGIHCYSDTDPSEKKYGWEIA